MIQQQQQQASQASTLPHQNIHQRAFGITVLIIEVAMAILYGFYEISVFAVINVSSIIFAILIAMLVIIGFGLYLSYLRSLLWTSLGVAFLIVCLALQLYPLVNSFWSKATIFQNPRLSDSFDQKGFRLFLANFDSYQSTGNTITGSIRCALAILVGASGIIGRATPLDLLIVTILGTITFELNRQITAQVGHDLFGSSTIFGFGGFMSFGAGLIFLLMQGQKGRQKKQISGISSSINSSLFGSLVMFLFLPVLAAEGDNSIKRQLFTNYVTPFYLILSMGSAIITSVAVSIFINNGAVRVRDVQNGLIAGAVVCGSASYFITSPVYAQICGVAGAIFQPIFEHVFQKKFYKKSGIFCTYPPAVFGLQSLISAVFTSIYAQRINSGSTNSFVYTGKQITYSRILGTYFISGGIGIVTGLIIGLVCRMIRPPGYFPLINDSELWQMRDGIRYPEDEVSSEQLRARNLAPEIAANLHISNIGQTPREGEAAILRKTTSYQQLQYQLDFVDMLQVPIQ